MKGKNQLLVGFRGSFENLTATQAKDGDTILKGKITSMTVPNTPGQVAQKNLFTAVIALATAALAFIRDSMEPSKPTRSGYNEFASVNINALKAAGQTDITVGFPELTFTKGGLYPFNPEEDTANPPVLKPDNTDVSFVWPYDPASQIQDGTDKVLAFIINDESYDWQTQDTTVTRSAAAGTVVVPKPSAGNNYVVLYSQSVSTGEYSTNVSVCRVAIDGSVTFL